MYATNKRYVICCSLFMFVGRLCFSFQLYRFCIIVVTEHYHTTLLHKVDHKVCSYAIKKSSGGFYEKSGIETKEKTSQTVAFSIVFIHDISDSKCTKSLKWFFYSSPIIVPGYWMDMNSNATSDPCAPHWSSHFIKMIEKV